jgi:hypothetical protein
MEEFTEVDIRHIKPRSQTLSEERIARLILQLPIENRAVGAAIGMQSSMRRLLGCSCERGGYCRHVMLMAKHLLVLPGIQSRSSLAV